MGEKSGKRGQEGGATLGTIVGIILLVLLLVIVAWSFTSQGKNFWAKTLSLQGGTTLDSAIQGCNLAASSNSQDSFCSDLKTVNLNGTNQYVTCYYIGQKLTNQLSCPVSDSQLVANCEALSSTGILVNGVSIRNVTANCTQVTNSQFAFS